MREPSDGTGWPRRAPKADSFERGFLDSDALGPGLPGRMPANGKGGGSSPPHPGGLPGRRLAPGLRPPGHRKIPVALKREDLPATPPDLALVRAINGSDREALLAALGHAGLFARGFVRGNASLLRLAAERLDLSGSPSLAAWAEWVRGMEGTKANDAILATVAEYVFVPGVPFREIPALLTPDENAAREMEAFERAGDWDGWDRAVAAAARAEGEPSPRVAIAEARGRRFRDCARAGPLLLAALRAHPCHFTIGGMLADELVWGLWAGEATESDVAEATPLLDALLARDPDDIRLAFARNRIRASVRCGLDKRKRRRLGVLDTVVALIDGLPIPFRLIRLLREVERAGGRDRGGGRRMGGSPRIDPGRIPVILGRSRGPSEF